jgi:hypothetical protein
MYLLAKGQPETMALKVFLGAGAILRKAMFLSLSTALIAMSGFISLIHQCSLKNS